MPSSRNSRLCRLAIIGLSVATPCVGQTSSLRCPNPTFDPSFTAAEVARLQTIRTELGSTNLAPGTGGGPLGCPWAGARDLSEGGHPWIAQKFQRGWILLGRGSTSGSEVAVIRGLNRWSAWVKGVSDPAIGPTDPKVAQFLGGVIGPLAGDRIEAPAADSIALWRCPSGMACTRISGFLDSLAGPFDVPARLGLVDLARPDSGRRTARIGAILPDWLGCHTRVPFTDPDRGEDHLARAIVMMRSPADCPLSLSKASRLVTQAMPGFEFPEGQLPGTTSDDPTPTCGRKGELDVTMVQLLHLFLTNRPALDSSLGRLQSLLGPWGGLPRPDPYVGPGGGCLGYAVIETENHILLQETARYLINDLLTPLNLGADYDNSRNRDWLLRFLQQIARRDFYEFNALPYTRYQLKALLALHDHAPDSTVRVAARGLLHWLFAKQALSGNLDRDHRPFRRLPERDRMSSAAWWGPAATASMVQAAVLAGPLQHMHEDVDLELDSAAAAAITQVDTFPSLATAGENFLADFVDIADTKYELPSALVGWLQRRYTDSLANRVTYLQAIHHSSPVADDTMLFAQPNSGAELMSGNRNWTMIAGGTSAPPGDPGPPPGGTVWRVVGGVTGAGAGAVVGGAIAGPPGALVGSIIGGIGGLFGGGLAADEIAANKQHDKLWESQPGVLRETILIPSPVGLNRGQTIRFSQPIVTTEREVAQPRLCVAEGFMCGFDLQMPSHPFPAKDAASCPILPDLPTFMRAKFDAPVVGDTTVGMLLGCLTHDLRDVGGWHIWRFELGMLALGNGDPAGQERWLVASILDLPATPRRLHLDWHLPGPHDWYNAHVYNVEVQPGSGDAPGGALLLRTVGDADDTDTWQNGSISLPLAGVSDVTWNVVIEGCDPTYGFLGIRTGHVCHADILPKVTVTVAPRPRQPFSCAAHPDPRVGDHQAGGLVLEVGSSCSRSPYGLYVYIWDEPCEPSRNCPHGFNDYGFVVAAPSRGWAWEDFAKAVRKSMEDEFAAIGKRYLPNTDTARIRVPISPADRLQDTTWVATDTGSGHLVSFRWWSANKVDGNIISDTGAPGVFGPLALAYTQWPTAAGHVTAPDVSGADGALLRSSGDGCFTLAGFPTRADSNPTGLVVDLRDAKAPRVEQPLTATLATRCP
jgi:hypothetical protein